LIAKSQDCATSTTGSESSPQLQFEDMAPPLHDDTDDEREGTYIGAAADINENKEAKQEYHEQN
jgi:hypothetical protein